MTTIQIKVKPNAKRSLLEENPDGSWTAFLSSPPRDGKANEELIRLLSKQFHCAKQSIVIKSGKSSRLKLVQIEND